MATTITRLSKSSPYARCALCPGFALVWADRALHKHVATAEAPALAAATDNGDGTFTLDDQKKSGA